MRLQHSSSKTASSRCEGCCTTANTFQQAEQGANDGPCHQQGSSTQHRVDLSSTHKLTICYQSTRVRTQQHNDTQLDEQPFGSLLYKPPIPSIYALPNYYGELSIAGGISILPTIIRQSAPMHSQCWKGDVLSVDTDSISRSLARLQRDLNYSSTLAFFYPVN